MTDLGDLGASRTNALSINAAGQVVGYAVKASIVTRAFIYSAGQMTDLGTLGGPYGFASDINATGQVVGSASTAANESRAFIYRDGHMTDLGTLGGTRSAASALNAAGQVVGSSTTVGDETHAFLYSAGHMTDLGTLVGFSSSATDVNSSGQVVGSAFRPGDPENHPFFYDKGTMFDVNDLVTGFTHLDPNIYINDAGQLAGTGRINGQRHAFLLTNSVDSGAIPEPASIALFGLGLLGAVASQRKSRQ